MFGKVEKGPEDHLIGFIHFIIILTKDRYYIKYQNKNATMLTIKIFVNF